MQQYYVHTKELGMSVARNPRRTSHFFLPFFTVLCLFPPTPPLSFLAFFRILQSTQFVLYLDSTKTELLDQGPQWKSKVFFMLETFRRENTLAGRMGYFHICFASRRVRLIVIFDQLGPSYFSVCVLNGIYSPADPSTILLPQSLSIDSVYIVYECRATCILKLQNCGRVGWKGTNIRHSTFFSLSPRDQAMPLFSLQCIQ